MNTSLAIGLSIVLIGAFFYISHWKGAEALFMIGFLLILIYTIIFKTTYKYYPLYNQNLKKGKDYSYLIRLIIFISILVRFHPKDGEILFYIILGLMAIDLCWTGIIYLKNYRNTPNH